MSLDATRWAWMQNIKPTMKLILLSLADRADEKHACHPSIERLQSDTGLNRKTIVSGIKKMSELGLILVGKKPQTKGKFSSNTYQLIGVIGREEPQPKNGTRVENNQDPKTGHGSDSPRPKNDLNRDPKTDKTATQNRASNLPVNLPKNLPKEIDTELFNDFLLVRKKLKAVHSDRAMNLLVDDLVEIIALGQDPNQAIKNSIKNSWKGVFPLKGNYSQPQQENQTRRAFPV